MLLEIRLLDVETVLQTAETADYFDWLGGHSENQEALEVSLRGSWLLCNPPPPKWETNTFKCD